MKDGSETFFFNFLVFCSSDVVQDLSFFYFLFCFFFYTAMEQQKELKLTSGPTQKPGL